MELEEDADDAFVSRGTGVPGFEALLAAALLTLFAMPRWRERERLGGTRARRSMLTTVVVRKESEACLSMYLVSLTSSLSQNDSSGMEFVLK